MIKVTDYNGKPLGLDHDYEYRGASREKNRNAPWIRGLILWAIFVALFLIAGIFALVKYIAGTTDNTFGETLFVTLFCFGISGLFLWLMYYGYKRHQTLLRAIGHTTDNKQNK